MGQESSTLAELKGLYPMEPTETVATEPMQVEKVDETIDTSEKSPSPEPTQVSDSGDTAEETDTIEKSPSPEPSQVSDSGDTAETTDESLEIAHKDNHQTKRRGKISWQQRLLLREARFMEQLKRSRPKKPKKPARKPFTGELNETTEAAHKKGKDVDEEVRKLLARRQAARKARIQRIRDEKMAQIRKAERKRVRKVKKDAAREKKHTAREKRREAQNARHAEELRKL